ncbi:MAG TPA: carboxypeptidase regulatory-like domain-containing protein [Terriglobia bacterium]|nr:carboxypeptidase regulatory-like domain-containing protein [Terriglobia bacterium]
MNVPIVCFVMLWSVVLMPVAAWAQSAGGGAIAGVVRDTSGAVIPGVMVEAVSPALIEKVRSVVSDERGLYRIVDLRPGSYSVTFTLPGFSTFKRDGIELTTSFTTTINAEMTAGSLAETVTVLEEAPVVDVQNVLQQTTIARDTLDAIPTTKRLGQYASIIPGATYTNPTFQDVGGNQGEGGQFGVHGQRGADLSTNVEGLNQNQQALGVFSFNSQAFQEIVVETSGMSAEAMTGGVQLNIISKDGGNRLSGSLSMAYTGPSLQMGNLTDALRARGLNTDISIRKSYDYGGALGGPIKKDKLWFFTAHRWWGASRYIQGSYFNKAQGTLFYEPDLDRVSHNDEYFQDHSLRLTWQVTPKHKIIGSFSHQNNCSCPFGLTGVGGVNAVKPAPESRGYHIYNPQFFPLVSWTYTATNRLLFEAGQSVLVLNEDSRRQPYVGPNDIRVTDLAINTVYGSDANNNIWSGSYVRRFVTKYNSRFSASHNTGSHSFKTGLIYQRYNLGRSGRYTDINQINQARSYTFRNRIPVSVTLWATPFEFLEHTTNLGLFVQDKWTVGKLTLNLGLRYDYLNGNVPAQQLPAGIFVPARDFPAVKNTPNWKNVNPRIGTSYDIFGNGKTAFKLSLGRFVPYTVTASSNPAANQAANATRMWDDYTYPVGDPRRGNYVPDCVLGTSVPGANGECGGLSDQTFGQVRAGNIRFADDAMTGFNRQFHNWQGSVSVQQELRQGMALNVGYFRTWYGGFLVTDNLAVKPDDFDPYCVPVPVDRRLRNGGEKVCGFYDIKPALFGATDNLRTQASNYGKRTEIYNGIDISLTSRFARGGQFSGGLSVGRTVTDACEVVAKLPEALLGTDPAANTGPGTLSAGTANSWSPSQFCHVTSPWSAGTQVKFLAVYPLPWGLQTSATYQNISGIPVTATYPAPNSQIATLLGRNLGSCRGAATCNANVNTELIAPNTRYEDRLQQVDLRFSKRFRVESVTLRGNFDIYNVFNGSAILSQNTGYGLQWLTPYETMGGRLFKFSTQFEF